MFIWLFLVALVLAVAGLLIYARRTAGSGFIGASQFAAWLQRPAHSVPAASHRPALARRDFRAVSIQCGPDACEAARKLEGRRGFPSQLPRLPLSQCNAESCTCSFRQHVDRRANDDRRNVYGSLTSTDPDGNERRTTFDRRSDAGDDDLATFNFRDA